MPIYEFLCLNHNDGGNHFEVLRKTWDTDRYAKCPLCGKLVARKLSMVNYTFGWRLTDESHHIKGWKDEFERNI